MHAASQASANTSAKGSQALHFGRNTQMTTRKLLCSAAIGALVAGPAMADVTLGYLADLSGATSVLSGEGSRIAIEMAIEDFGGEVLGEPIVLLSADHLSQADTGSSIVREWIDVEGVNVVLSADNSAVALAVSPILAEAAIPMLHGASTSALTNDQCEPLQIQALMDTYGLSRAITVPLVEAGNDQWFFMTVDYAFGQALEAAGAAAIEEAGGTVVGSIRHSPEDIDFSAYLLEAQASGANAIGLATFGAWQIAIAKQADEFGMDLPLVPYFLGITDVEAAGIENLQGIRGAVQFYWNENDATRAFSARFEERYGRPPTFTNAMMYETVTHYLESVATAGTTDGPAVDAAFRATPIDMIRGGTTTVREDGRQVRPMLIYETRTPEEVTTDWDFFEIVGETEADGLLLPLAQSTCRLLNAG